jgi:hypothetical protein
MPLRIVGMIGAAGRPSRGRVPAVETVSTPRRRWATILGVGVPLEVTKCTRGLLVTDLSSGPSVLIGTTTATRRSR